MTIEDFEEFVKVGDFTKYNNARSSSAESNLHKFCHLCIETASILSYLHTFLTQNFSVLGLHQYRYGQGSYFYLMTKFLFKTPKCSQLNLCLR